ASATPPFPYTTLFRSWTPFTPGSKAAGGRKRLHRARDGQDGGIRAQLFQRYRFDRFLRRRRAGAQERYRAGAVLRAIDPAAGQRSEEHTSELQSRENL